MPSFKKISISVVTPQGPLSPLGIEASLTTNTYESYISSQTDTYFWVSIMPDNNFSSSPLQQNSSSPIIDLTQDEYDKLESIDYDDDTKPQEWHLLAKVFLDDREQPDTTSIVYLPWNGKVKERILKGRVACTADGRSVERLWYFKEFGLETFVKSLSVTDPDPDGDLAVIGAETPISLEDNLQEMMQSLGTEMGGAKTPGIGKVGQIRVVLQRIVITGASWQSNYRPELHDEDEQQEPHNPGGVSHLARVGEAMNITFSAIRKTYCEAEAEPYATFIFNYRSDEQLRKIGLLDPLGSSHKKLKNLIPFLTPLTFNEKAEKVKSLVECNTPSLDDLDSDQGMRKLPALLEASKSDELVIRDASFSSLSKRGSEQSDDGDCEPRLPTLSLSGPLTLPEVGCQQEVALIISTSQNSTLSPPVSSLHPLDTCYNSDSETDTHTPLAIMNSGGRSTIRLRNSETDESLAELTKGLQMTKRGYYSEGDDSIDRESGEENRQTKRLRRIKSHEDNVDNSKAM